MVPILDQTIESLLDRSFTISFFNGVLLSEKDNLFCIYFENLCGKVYFNSNGTLRLNCYYKFKDLNHSQTYSNLLNKHYNCVDFGDINPIEEFLHMEFMINGNRWITSSFLLTSHIIKGEGIEIDISISNIMYTEYREHDEGLYRAYIPIKARIFLPLNKIEYYDKSGFSNNECDFSVNNINITIRKEKYYYLLSVRTNNKDDTNRISRIFKEAFNIYQGQEVPYFLETQIFNGIEFKVIKSQSENNKKSLSIFRTVNDRTGLDDLKKFIQHYLEFHIQPYSEMYEWWKKINDVTDNIFEVKALVISVAIEGLLNDYYKHINTKTSNFLDILEVNKQLLRKNKFLFDPLFYERLYSSLGYMGRDTSSTKLTYLCNQGLIDKKLLKTWKGLRNPLAHGDYPTVTNGLYEEMAMHQKKLVTCLELFYRLIFIKIGYSGNFKQLSDNKLRLDNYQFYYPCKIERPILKGRFTSSY